MNINSYLKRINISDSLNTDISLSSFIKLHECHVRSVPFENLDVQNKIEISLNVTHLYDKIVHKRRGGFCYELNYLFQLLLAHLGYGVRLISASIFDQGVPGPAYDHMALIVEFADQRWLADVGFGDLFIRPLNIDKPEIQVDHGNRFRIEKVDPETYLLYMSKNGSGLEKKYLFNTVAQNIEQFQEQCEFKQFSPDSHFVKNKIVTRPTLSGRKTLLNHTYIKRSNGEKTHTPVENPSQELQILKEAFDIELE